MAIFDELKSVAKVLQEAGKIEQYQQILSVQEKLLEQQKHIYELETDNRELKEKLKTQESLTYRNNAYWRGMENPDGPFCSRCWDVEKNMVRIKQAGNPAFHTCPECKTTVQTNPSYSPPYRRIDNYDSTR